MLETSVDPDGGSILRFSDSLVKERQAILKQMEKRQHVRPT